MTAVLRMLVGRFTGRDLKAARRRNARAADELDAIIRGIIGQ